MHDRTAIRTRLYGNGGLMPTFVVAPARLGPEPDAATSTTAATRSATRSSGCARKTAIRYEGIQMQLVNPVTGKPVFPTLNYKAQLLRPGEETQSKRETCGTFIVVMEGKGYSEIGGQRFDWEPNDIMVVPNFLWRQHVNTGKSDAMLYTVSDAALLQEHRPVPRAGQGQGRQGDPARAVSAACDSRSNDQAPPFGRRFCFDAVASRRHPRAPGPSRRRPAR